MPAWPGGLCPQCGDEMPARIVHCRSCRLLLNDDLEVDTVVEPVFMPLQEISSMATIEPRGIFDDCPACGRELRAARKYAGQQVRCKHCGAGFTLGGQIGSRSGPKAWFADCPHCRRELRIAAKYAAQRVACNFCGGEIELRGASPSPSPTGK